MKIEIFTTLKLMYFIFLKNPKSLNNEKLEALYRARIHGIEKKANDEDTTDFASIIQGRQLYHEIKRRNILSKEEIKWSERVLFGKSLEKKVERVSDSSYKNLIDVIKDRRSVRSWDESKITDDNFNLLIEAAKWAPSSSHRQTWHFLLTRDREKIKILAEIRGQKFVKNASNCILVLINLEAYNKVEVNYTPYLDAGAAIQNLLLMVHRIGLGACWVNFGKHEIPDPKKMEIIKTLFAIPENFKIMSIIPLGTSSRSSLTAPGRKSTKDIIHIEKF